MGFALQQKPINAQGDAVSKIISDIVYCENQIHQFFQNQKIGSLLKRSNIDKEKCISPVAVFHVLLSLVFTGKNLFHTLEAGECCGMAKDTVYRFLNSVHTKWLALLTTDTALGNKEIIPAFKHRWDIEVFLRCSSRFSILLKNARGGFMTRLSPMLPWCAVDISLPLAKRTNQDTRTLGTLFHACFEELRQATFAEALARVLIFLEHALGAAPEMTNELIRSLIDRFLRELPPIYGTCG